MRPRTQKQSQVKKELCRVLDYENVNVNFYVFPNWVSTKNSVDKRDAVLNNSMPFTLTLFLAI